jgi:hypothetical protein
MILQFTALRCTVTGRINRMGRALCVLYAAGGLISSPYAHPHRYRVHWFETFADAIPLRKWTARKRKRGPGIESIFDFANVRRGCTNKPYEASGVLGIIFQVMAAKFVLLFFRPCVYTKTFTVARTSIRNMINFELLSIVHTNYY